MNNNQRDTSESKCIEGTAVCVAVAGGGIRRLIL